MAMSPRKLQLSDGGAGLIIIIFGLVVLCVGIAICYAKPLHKNVSGNAGNGQLPVKFYATELFVSSLNKSERLAADYPSTKKIIAGIVPHDLAHSEYIAYFFRKLKKQSPKTIILIGPNHWEGGSSNFITTAYSWSTAFGTLSADSITIKRLVSNNLASQDSGVMINEHSISGLIPYISFYLPNAKILPLILKSEASHEEIATMANWLNNNLPKSTIMIASVDFSHYLTSKQAQLNDLVTETALKNLDTEKIMSFGKKFNDYLDSPPAIDLLLTWARRQGSTGNKILFHNNSGNLSGNANVPVTSYFVATYY